MAMATMPTTAHEIKGTTVIRSSETETRTVMAPASKNGLTGLWHSEPSLDDDDDFVGST